jgi:hypothetical protein
MELGRLAVLLLPACGPQRPRLSVAALGLLFTAAARSPTLLSAR